MGRETPLPASREGSVVLDLGGAVGAAALRAPAEWDGREVELAGPGGARTHSIVRERRVPGGPVFAAVYPGLAAGRYRVLPDGPAFDVEGGRVIEADVSAPAEGGGDAR